MKALTVRQPWASLIVHGPKWIETRSKPTKIRGRIGIIAGPRRPAHALTVDEFVYYRGAAGDVVLRSGWGTKALHGALIGTVELYDCVPILDGLTDAETDDEHGARIVAEVPYGAWEYSTADDQVGHDLSDQLPYGDFNPGRWAWLLRDPQPLAEPIPMRGSSGWQEVELS